MGRQEMQGVECNEHDRPAPPSYGSFLHSFLELRDKDFSDGQVASLSVVGCLNCLARPFYRRASSRNFARSLLRYTAILLLLKLTLTSKPLTVLFKFINVTITMLVSS